MTYNLYIRMRYIQNNLLNWNILKTTKMIWNANYLIIEIISEHELLNL